MNETNRLTNKSNQRSASQAKRLSLTLWLKDKWALVRAFLFKEHAAEDLRDQLEEAVGLGAEGDADLSEAAFSEQERMMIANILRYGALRVEDVMVPRADIQAIDEQASLQDLLLEFQSGGHSRIPTYNETLDDPTGMVHVKDLLSWIADHHEQRANLVKTHESLGLKVITGGKQLAEDFDVNELGTDEGSSGEESRDEANIVQPAHSYEQAVIGDPQSITDLSQKIKQSELQREVLYVPPSMPVMNLLLRMQSTRVHMALVVDEYGGTDGLLSIEDLIEEVVGEIEDEHDENNGALISGALATGLTVSARTPIEELEARTNVQLFAESERDDDIDTVGGLIFALVGRIPVRGEVITHKSGLEIEVLSADPRRIKTLKITKKPIEGD